MHNRWRLPGSLFAFLASLVALSGAVCLASCDRKDRAGGAGSGGAGSTLNVFAAASLTEPFKGIGAGFEKDHPGVRVDFNFAGSQQLKAQLEEGAPADVFASANRKEMDSAAAAGLVPAGGARTFARNRLVVIVPRDNPAHIASPADLARPGVKLDLADSAVPVGNYTLVMFDRMSKDAAYGRDFKARAVANVVSREENVKSVLTKVRLGEADAGVVYTSDVSGSAAAEVGVLEVPEAFNPTAEYPIAVLARSRQPALAGQFVEYVLSAVGQAMLRRHGFLPARPGGDGGAGGPAAVSRPATSQP